MWALIIIAVLALPVGVALVILKDLEDMALDSVAARIRNNPAIAKRAPFFRPLRKGAGALSVFAVLPVGVCIQGATAEQWRTMGLVSAGMLGAGSLLLGLWWVLSSRKVASEAAQA